MTNFSSEEMGNNDLINSTNKNTTTDKIEGKHLLFYKCFHKNNTRQISNRKQ